MSTPPSKSDARLEQAIASDESLLAAHEKLLGKQPDERAHYKLLPLNLLFVFSGLIFFAGTYISRYAGVFDPSIYNEYAHPQPAGAAVVAVDPLVFGKKLYNNAACNTCHMDSGIGQPGIIPPLAGSEWVTGSEERLIRIVLHGIQGPITVKGANYSSAMPAFGKVAGSGYNWSDDKVAAVLTYIRSEWGNQAGPITTEQVAAIRSKVGDHPAWSAADLLKLP